MLRLGKAAFSSECYRKQNDCY